MTDPNSSAYDDEVSLTGTSSAEEEAPSPEAEPDEAAPEPIVQQELPEGDRNVDRIKAQLSLAAKRVVSKTATADEQSAKIERLCLSQGPSYHVAFKRFYQAEYDRFVENPETAALTDKQRAAATPQPVTKKSKKKK